MHGLACDDDGLERFRLVASGIAGQPLEVAAARPGERSWCDGTTVFLEPGARRQDQVRMVAVQASLVATGGLDAEILGQIRRPALARRYLAVEGHRALLANESVLPPFVRSLIDRDVASSITTAAASLDWARGRRTVEEPPRVFGAIHARQALASIRRTSETPVDRLLDIRRRPAAGEPTPLAEDESEEGMGDLLSSPVGGRGAVGRLLATLLRPSRRRDRGGPPGVDAPTHRTSDHPGVGRDAAASRGTVGELDVATIISPEKAGAAYPEWDGPRRRYRANWCTVFETDARASATPTMPMPSGLAMRRSLARLGTGLTYCRRQAQGEDIDIDAAVEAHIDRAAGASHGEDVYLDLRRRRRDLGVLVLLDISGSAGEPGVAGRPVHEHQRLVAATLTAALHDLGDRVALYAFNSRGRQAVQLLRVKGFDDHLDAQVIRRLASLEPSAYTRLGAAIRHGATILERRSGTPRRLLVVLSDGFAYDHGYEGRYGEADARRALTEARRRGSGCLCISVGANAEPEALRRVFGSAAHATASSPDLLPVMIAPLFRSALGTAERQHRAFQRKERTRERLGMEEGS